MVGGQGGEVNQRTVLHSGGVGMTEKAIGFVHWVSMRGVRRQTLKPINKASILYPLQSERYDAPLHLCSHLDRHVIGVVGEPDHKLAPAL